MAATDPRIKSGDGHDGVCVVAVAAGGNPYAAAPSPATRFATGKPEFKGGGETAGALPSALATVANLDRLSAPPRRTPMPTRNISLTAQQAAFIDEMLKTGEYRNASEAFRDAIRALHRPQKRTL